MSAPGRNGGFGMGLGSGRFVILDLCRRSGRIQVITPDEDPGTSASRNNAVYRVAEGEGALIRKAMALGSNVLDGVNVLRDFPLPALLEEEEEEEEEGESLGSSRSLADHGDGCELSADGESDICDYSDEDAEGIDALLASTGDDDDDEGWADGDSLKGCGRSKRGRIMQTFQRLRSIVGADSRMDTAAVFDEAIQYLKALQLQARSQDSRDDVGIVPDG